MEAVVKKYKYWTDAEIMEDAKKYKTRSEWQYAKKSGYRRAKARGFLEEACAHMPLPPEAWTDERIIEDAKKYSSKKEWQNNSSSGYSLAHKKGLVDIACAHMTQGLKKWTNEDLAAEASKYDTLIDWVNNSKSSYATAYRRGIVKEISSHMKPASRVRIWTEDAILKDALRFDSKSIWKKESPGGYYAALDKGLMNLASMHMTSSNKTWSKEEILADAAKYSTIHEWRSESSLGYSAAHRHDLLSEATAHMVPSERKSAADVIYIWRAVGWAFNGKCVYKIGLTSSRRKKARLTKGKRSADAEVDIILMIKVPSGGAYKIEKELLSIGDNPKYSGFDGCTEFRAMSEAQLQVAIETATKYACT